MHDRTSPTDHTTREISSGPYHGRIRDGSALDRFLKTGGRPEDLFAREARPLKTSGSTRSALVSVQSQGDIPEILYGKAYVFKNYIHALKPLFQKNRAQEVWEISWHLLAHGVPVPLPAGYLLKSYGPFCIEAYYFSEFVPEALHLGRTARIAKEQNDLASLIPVLDRVAHSVAVLHENAITHGDLKWTNILVSPTGEQVWFVDLDAARLHNGLPPLRLVARDLARFILNGLAMGLNASTLDRFLERYALARHLPREVVDKPLAKAIRRLEKNPPQRHK